MKMSFLDNLQNNLKALENLEQGGIDESRRRDADRARALEVEPWADRLKSSPWTSTLMQLATRAGFSRRMKVNFIWLGTTLRLEAREQRLELRPAPDCVNAVFLFDGNEVKRTDLNLEGTPQPVLDDWMAMLDARV